MYEIVYTNRMKHDAKLMQKRGKNMQKLVEVLELLSSSQILPEKFKDHQLQPVPMQICLENKLLKTNLHKYLDLKIYSASGNISAILSL